MARTLITQRDFSLGANRDSAPHEIDPRGLYDLFNGTADLRGGVKKRGGTANKSGSAFGSAGLTWIWDGYFDAGQRTVFANTADFGVLGSDDATVITLGSDGLTVPKPSAFLAGMLFVGGGYAYSGSRMAANYTTGTVTTVFGSKTVTGSGTTWNTLVDAGMLFQVADGRVYPVASVDSTTQITLRDPYEIAGAAGLSYTLSPIYKITTPDPYEAGEFYTVCANRLCRASANKVYFSEINRPHDWTASVEGISIPNEHELPNGVQIIGLATAGQALLIFTTSGIWLLSGLAFNIVDPTGNPQHSLQVLSREMVLWGTGAGIASWSQAAVVPTIDGIFLIDGTTGPTRISKPIDELYRSYVETGYRAGQATVFRGHYLLPILSASGTSVRDMLVSRLDRPVRSDGQPQFPWARFSGAGGSLSSLAVRVTTAGVEPLLLGAEMQASSRIVDATAFFEPDADHKQDADGSNIAFMAITRDYETGNLIENVVRYLTVCAEMVEAADDDNPSMHFEVGFGGPRHETGPYFWDNYDWADESVTLDPDDLYWAPEDDDVYRSLRCVLRSNPGTEGKRCRVNGDAIRFVRFRLTNDTPCASLILRWIEIAVRPSQAVRR